jgi:hypothetical protein
MIKIFTTSTGTAPRSVCAVCHQPIDDSGMAMVAFEQPQAKGTYSEVAFLHKGECDEAYKGGHSRAGGWVELDHFLVDLCHNSGLTAEKLPAAIKSRDKIREALGGA